MITSILAFLTPIVLNSIMGIVKWMGAQDMSTAWKRFLLAMFSIAGVIAMNQLNGTPIDMNSVSNLVSVALESLIAFVAAHGSYHLFWSSK